MLGNPLRKHYTDSVDIWREVEILDGAITKNQRQKIYTGIPCRVYQSGRPSPYMKDTAAEITTSDKLMCDNDVDVRAGDELFVTRGGNRFGLHRSPLRYFAGKPQYYDDLLSHQELAILRKERN